MVKRCSLQRCFLLLLLWLAMTCPQMAQATLSFPATGGILMPSGCSGSNGVYTCGSLNLQENVQFNDTTSTVTITVNGTLTFGNYTFGSASQTPKVTFIVNGSVTSSSSVIYANITSNASSTNNASISIGNSAKVYGDLTATATSGGFFNSAYVYIYDNAQVAGNVSAVTQVANQTARVEKWTNATVSGSITATAVTSLFASVMLNTGAVGGSVISSGNLTSSAQVAGCVQSTANSILTPIILSLGSTSGGVCCGNNGSCGTGCVYNFTLASMPPTCGSSNVASGFNCTLVGGTSNTGRLMTQVAGSSFNIDVIALQNSGAVETNYVSSGTKNVTLEFVDGTSTTACASRASLNPTVSQTVTFSASDAGRKTVSTTINKAYRDLMCRVTDNNQAPSVVACSSDDFAVRPSSLTISSAGGSVDADAAGTSTTATPTKKAGSSFALNATANISGYDGTPQIDNSKISAHSGATAAGTVSGSFGSAVASTSVASGNAFSYSEAGYFRFAANGVYDSTFTAVDSAKGDCATGFNASGGLNACSFGNTSNTSYFGRFIPDHFAITLPTTTPACSSSFTYFGQDGVSTGFTLRAENSSNALTQNYTGSFAKFSLNNWANYNFSAATLPTGVSLSASATAPSGTWSNGSANVVAKHILSRPSATVAPASITFSAAPSDSDGVTMSSAAVSSATLFRYGRLNLASYYGSELLPLSVPIEAQYWNGTAYQRNQLDSCSSVPASSIAMSNYKNNLTACETQLTGAGTMNAGKTTYTLSKPGVGNSGSVDLSVNLNSASGSTCNSATQTSATAANIPWFGTSNTSARETFGLFKTPVIYMRENF